MPTISPTLSRRCFRPYLPHSIGSIAFLSALQYGGPSVLIHHTELAVLPSPSIPLGATTALVLARHLTTLPYFITRVFHPLRRLYRTDNTTELVGGISVLIVREEIPSLFAYLRVSLVTLYVAQWYLVFIRTRSNKNTFILP